MFTINISSNVEQVMGRVVGEAQKQIPYAIALALTRTAAEAKLEVDKKLPEIFDRPTPFTMRAIGYKGATKQNLTSQVFVRDIQAKYLKLQVTGGTRTPRNRALVLPTDFPTDNYGNLPRGAVKRLLARSDVFSGKVRGVPGIWQRTGRGLVLLISYEPKATYQKRFDFVGIVRKVVEQRVRVNLEGALAVALRTAR